MFFVFNKEKIYSYIIAVSTVIILFAISTLYLDNNTIEASSNIINEETSVMNNTSNETNVNN